MVYFILIAFISLDNPFNPCSLPIDSDSSHSAVNASPRNRLVGKAGPLVDQFQVITESLVLVAAVIRTEALYLRPAVFIHSKGFSRYLCELRKLNQQRHQCIKLWHFPVEFPV